MLTCIYQHISSLHTHTHTHTTHTRSPHAAFPRVLSAEGGQCEGYGVGQQELTTVLRGRPGQGGSGLRHEGNSLSTSVQRNSFCMYLSSTLSTCLSMVLERMSDTWRAILSLHVHTCIMHTHTHPPSYTSCPRSSAPLAVCSRSQTRYSTMTSTQLCRWYVPNPRNGAFSLTGVHVE